MRVGLVTARIGIPAARSLKDKRSVLRGLKDRVRQQINLSVAEVGDQDKWQVTAVSEAAFWRLLQGLGLAEMLLVVRNPPAGFADELRLVHQFPDRFKVKVAGTTGQGAQRIAFYPCADEDRTLRAMGEAWQSGDRGTRDKMPLNGAAVG